MKKSVKIVVAVFAIMASAFVMNFFGVSSASAAPIVRPSQFIMGVNTHMVPSEMLPRTSDGLNQAQIAIQFLGASTVRDEVGWDGMGTSGWGQVFPNYLPAAGGKLTLILDYSNTNYVSGGAFPNTTAERSAFLTYAQNAVAAVGLQNIAAIEIWNEWDLYSGWWDGYPSHNWGDPCPDDPTDGAGCPRMYAQLVETMLYPEREGLSQPGLRAIAPGVPIIAIASSAFDQAWTEAVLTQLKNRNVQIDGASTHPYVDGPDGCSGSSSTPAGPQVAANCTLAFYNSVASSYGQAIPVYITEVGWSTGGGTGTVSADTQARYLTEYFVRARAATDVAGIWWYDLLEDITTDTHVKGYGLIQRDTSNSARPGTTKQAGYAYQSLNNFWKNCGAPTGSYQSTNRVFTLSCPAGDRKIILNATSAELTSALTPGATLVDLIGNLPNVASGGDVTPLIGRHVGVIPAPVTGNVPDAPQSLTLTPGNNQITASWQAPVDNGGSAIVNYTVSISSNGGATWSQTQTVTGLTYTFTGLNSTTTYTVQVYATNATGSGATTTTTGRPAYVTLTMPGTNPTISVLPSSTASFSSTSFTPTVASNTGYQMTLSTSGSTTALVNGANTIPASSGTVAAPITLAANTWGFRVDDFGGFGSGPTYASSNAAALAGTWAGVPPVGSPVTIANDSATTGRPVTIWFGLGATSAKLSGNYTQTIVITVVGN